MTALQRQIHWMKRMQYRLNPAPGISVIPDTIC
jgi:hypothetical protein